MLPRLPTANDVHPYLSRIDDARVYSNFGPLVTELEGRYAQYLNVNPQAVVTVSSATQGLIGAISVSGARSWTVPVWTFPATGLSVLLSGYPLVLADVLHDSWLLDPKIQPKDSGVVPVMPFGGPVQLEAWSDWNEVVIDAAASIGQEPDLGCLPANYSVVFSLHATKVLGCGEGGIVVFGDVSRAQEFRAWTNFGFAGSRTSKRIGTNAKMAEVSAAYALAALDNWSLEKQEWEQAHRLAMEVMTRLGLSGGPTVLDGTTPYWIVELETEEMRIEAERRLAEQGVQTRKWWPAALSEMPVFEGHAITCEPFPSATALAHRVLGLPMFRKLPTHVAELVAEALSNL